MTDEQIEAEFTRIWAAIQRLRYKVEEPNQLDALLMVPKRNFTIPGLCPECGISDGAGHMTACSRGMEWR